MSDDDDVFKLLIVQFKATFMKRLFHNKTFECLKSLFVGFQIIFHPHFNVFLFF